MSPKLTMKNISSRLKRRFHADDQESSPSETPQFPSSTPSTGTGSLSNPKKVSEHLHSNHPVITKDSVSRVKKPSWRKHHPPWTGSSLLPSTFNTPIPKPPATQGQGQDQGQDAFASGLPLSPEALAQYKHFVSHKTGGNHTASGAAGISPMYPHYGSSSHQGSELTMPTDHSSMNSSTMPNPYQPPFYSSQPFHNPAMAFQHVYPHHLFHQTMPSAPAGMANPATANQATAPLYPPDLFSALAPTHPMPPGHLAYGPQQFTPLFDEEYAPKHEFSHQQFPYAWGGNVDMTYSPQPAQGPLVGKATADDNISRASRESSVNLEQIAVDPALVDKVTKALEPLQQFVRKSLDRTCAGCPQRLAAGVDDVGKMANSWAAIVTSADAIIDKNRVIVLGWKCQDKHCSVLTCPGCGADSALTGTGGRNTRGRSTGGRSDTFQISGMTFTAKWCCDDGRLMAIWALASGYTRSISKPHHAPQVASSQVATPPVATHPIATHPVANHLGYMIAHGKLGQHPARPQGVGYGGKHALEDMPSFRDILNARDPRKAVPTQQNTIDHEANTRREAKFRLVTLLLPIYELGIGFDVAPPEWLSHILSRSLLVERVANMLSNDPIHEIAVHRYGIFDALLDFLDALGHHPAIALLLYGERRLYHGKEGRLLDVSFGLCKNKAKMVPKDTGKSLFGLLGDLTAQAQAVKRHSSENSAVFETRDGQKLLKLSQRLIQFSASHAANAKKYQTKTAADTTNPKTLFADWHGEHCLSEVPDEKLLHNFAFAAPAQEGLNPAAAAAATPGRMKKLITELSTMQTSLPEGIFIRHGSSRLDAMKVLIMGPKDTPYEHGLFEFDLYCSLKYPKEPPMMRFKTTNRGRVRFNPNLYENGMVCLSLLGTWAGEPWRPNQSTLLQILVSIQSMIFCENPWYNEPGRENRDGKTQSAKYNNDVRGWTLQHALLPWIEACGAKGRKGKSSSTMPEEPSLSLWKDTARLYIQTNAKAILDSSRVAASNSKNSGLLHAAKAVAAALQTGEYLS